ncbi:hypothetical protein [Saccharopolyspora taberi]|uniref:DUF4253 domain-containing protein n=1 Tax=Saccharopolyspora taberi TaxID=60895 RepID=A0ABN3VB16_9PSEU
MALTAERIPGGLPSGRLVVPDERVAGPGVTEPVLWVSRDPVPEPEAGQRWGELLQQREETGLWPLLLGGTGSGGLRPWHTGELAPTPADAIDDVDLAERCVAEWEDMEEGLDEPMPYPAWPGMAPPAQQDGDPDERAVAVAASVEGIRALIPADDHGPYFGLVEARDSAITVCGWRPEVGAETVAAMVHSWEQRFGVRLCSLGGVSTVCLTVGWPRERWNTRAASPPSRSLSARICSSFPRTRISRRTRPVSSTPRPGCCGATEPLGHAR